LFSIPASFDSKTVHVRLPAIEKVTELWNFLEILFEELMCCENFYTSQHMVGACSKCSKQGLQPVAIKKGEACCRIQKQLLNFLLIILWKLRSFCFRLYGRDFVDKQRNINSFSSVLLSKVH
jgi:hypothetical protein